jgi:UDP-glucose:(heptosyl)LPS alpha-1,3-glucosyltransferase
MISGDADPRLEALAKRLGIIEQIHLLPYQEDLRPAYHTLDGFVMTSRYEAGWPIVILEALACGLPLVSSTGPGMSDIGHGGLSHCWTAAVGDVKGFTQAFTSLVNDLTQGRPNNHREIAETRFSPERCYGAILKAYQSQLIS